MTASVFLLIAGGGMVVGLIIGFLAGDVRGWYRANRELKEIAARHGWDTVVKYLKESWK